MKQSVIEVNHLTKIFNLYNHRIDRLKESLHPLRKTYHHPFFALKDVSFKVNKGESIGVIGRNGAGKSTLLKIITGVLTASSGEMRVAGKIASLLELGAGFNPELSGLENIYFYGLLLGATHKEMHQRKDSIIEFAEIGEFIHQPVKTYSSGMFVRLAFSVATMIEPDILIVDEALSVGDSKFQRKCYAKLEKLRQAGTTILFVTHDLDLIKLICDRSLVFENGQLIFDGSPSDGVMKYLEILYPQKELQQISQQIPLKVDQDSPPETPSSSQVTIFPETEFRGSSYGNGGGSIQKVEIFFPEPPNCIRGGQKLQMKIHFEWDSAIVKKLVAENTLIPDLSIGVALSDVKTNYFFGCNTFDKKIPISPFEQSHAVFTLNLHMPNIKPGDYFFTLALVVGCQTNHVHLKWYDGLIEMKVLPSSQEVFGFLSVDYEYERLK